MLRSKIPRPLHDERVLRGAGPGLHRQTDNIKRMPPVCFRSEAHAYLLNRHRQDHLREGTIQMAELKKAKFDAAAFLANAGLGRRVLQLKPKRVFFSQGTPSD